MEKQELKFLGRGSCFNVKEGNTAAYMEDPTGNGDLLLIDCGGTVFSKIIELGILKNKKRIFIVITHTHADHIGSLADLIFYCVYAANIEVYLLGNNEYATNMNNISNMIEILKLNGIEHSMFKIFSPRTDITIDPAKIYNTFFSIDTCIPEDHRCYTSNSFGYLIYINCLDEYIYYSGDTANLGAMSLKRVRNSDFIYYDCAIRTKSPSSDSKYPHVNIFEIVDIFNHYNISTDKLRLMHIDCDGVLDEASLFGIKVVDVEK